MSRLPAAPPVDPDTRSAATLLHATSYLCLRAGRNRRALAFLLVAHRIAPADPAILRALAVAFLANDSPRQALGALDQLAPTERTQSPALQLLRARALRLAGHDGEARAAFATYLSLRKTP